MCIRDRPAEVSRLSPSASTGDQDFPNQSSAMPKIITNNLSGIPCFKTCLLYTSDAADERSSVDLGGRRIIKKKKKRDNESRRQVQKRNKERNNIRGDET